MPDFAKENAFYLSTSPTRFAKALAQYEAFKATIPVPGAIVECGVFKGASFCRLALMRELFCNPTGKDLIGFDTFDRYFPADYGRDVELRANLIAAAGEHGISRDDLMDTLEDAECYTFNVRLVAGDICETVPSFVSQYPELKISLLNLDVDFYPAAKTVLEHLWPRVSQGGLMLIDDYGVFEGETRAVDEYFQGKAKIRRMSYAYSPCFLRKE